MTCRTRLNRALSLVMFLAAGPGVAGHLAAAQPDEEPAITKREPTKFIRILYDEYKNPVSLQTATTRYVLKDSDGKTRLEVFLESAIHIADRAYFKEFNQRFRHYDAVLYELVAPPEKRIPDPEQELSNPIRLVQQLAADGLGFAHQVSEIDYKVENMVHADLSPEQMAAARQKRGDDQFTMLADLLVHMMREVNRQTPPSELVSPAEPGEEALDLSVLSDPNGAVRLRRMLATEFAKAGSLEAALPASHIQALIRDRNVQAMQVFQQQLDQKRERIAFFWGAAHMEDLEKRLVLDYGMQLDGIYWRDAWDLRDGAVERAPLESVLENTLRDSLHEALRQLFPKK